MNQQTAQQFFTILIGICMYSQFMFGQGTSVDCPGEEAKVLCNEDQVAICWIGDSVSSQRCLTPPEEIDGRALDLWLLSYVLDDTLTVTDESIEFYRAILKKGKWECNAYKVAFSLPRGWKGTH